ncbi:MAG: hypothetical protein V1736_07315 [Pseudomonadota bacterium]
MKTLSKPLGTKSAEHGTDGASKNAGPATTETNPIAEQVTPISFEEGMDATAYLLRSPDNRAHLERSLKDVKEGRLVTLSTEDLCEPDEDRLLVQAAARLAENVFQKVWDNPDDAEYDHEDEKS